MEKIIHNKAVRDKIPEIITQSGKNCKVKKLSDIEFLLELENKLKEETNEYLQSKSVDELADIFEVILKIADLKGIDHEHLDKIRQEKISKKGAFEKNIFLIDVELQMGCFP